MLCSLVELPTEDHGAYLLSGRMRMEGGKSLQKVGSFLSNYRTSNLTSSLTVIFFIMVFLFPVFWKTEHSKGEYTELFKNQKGSYHLIFLSH